MRRQNNGHKINGKKRPPCFSNVIQIRMTERELELKYVPVSFFVKKTEKKG